jgi:hypothetical protein
MRRFILLFAFFWVCACSGAVPETTVVGSYVANYGAETATLTVKADHTYTHAVMANGSQVAEQVSTWKSTQLSSSWVETTAVDFRDFFPIPSFGEAKRGKKGGWVPEVERTWLGRIQLCFDSDLGYCYVKQYKQ